MPTPTEIKAFFDDNGYYLARGLYKPGEVALLEKDFDRIVAQNIAHNDAPQIRWQGERTAKITPDETFLLHTHQVQYYSSRWDQALRHPGFLDTAEAMLGPDIVLHHTKLFQKPAERGAPFPMHQDWSYFPSVKDTMMAAIIHVSRATDEMGCLRVYPGSHKLGRVQHSGGQEQSEFMEQNYPLEKATVVEAEPGDVLFFHYFTIHGSLPNRSRHLRKTVLVQLYAGHDRMEPNPPMWHEDTRTVLRGWSNVASQSYCQEHNAS